MKTNHQFHVICVDRAGHSFIDQGIKLYSKHIQKYASLHWHEIKASRKQFPFCQTEETLLLLKKMETFNAQNTKIFILSDSGKSHNSLQFSGLMENTMHACHQIVFVIGGAFGFSQEIFQKPHLKISLSPLTFNHDLVRMILLEQIFRSLTIMYKHPYHH